LRAYRSRIVVDSPREALRIGATTAIFSVVYGVLLKPLPFHEPERRLAIAPGIDATTLE